MSTSRTPYHAPVQLFGRRTHGCVVKNAPPVLSKRFDDVRLFALTFLGGFLFMTVYLG